jgi:hypothetical protein
VRAALILLYLVATAPAASAEPDETPRAREVRFAGARAIDQMCACLLDARQAAERHGRIDFSVDVAFAGDHDVTARIWMGHPYAVGRITFTGHNAVNDSTLRRAMSLYERELFDVTRLRRSIARINGLGHYEPLTLSDMQIVNRDDGVTADLMIPLRERKGRWWSISGPAIPGLGMLQASVSSRLPAWGRGLLEASTYFVTFNVIGFVPALVRPVIAGQEWLSGFVISPRLSPQTMLTHYGTTQLAHRISALLEEDANEPLAVPVSSATQPGRVLVCHPPKARLWWLRRGLNAAVNIALAR